MNKPALEELFETAEMYGCVSIYSSKNKAPPKCYSCTIRFSTINHVELKAESEFNLELHEALSKAIERAVLIVESVSNSVPPESVSETKKLIGMS